MIMVITVRGLYNKCFPFSEFGVFLAEITVDPNSPLAIRQLASVLLKQYVQSHWSQQSDKFRVPETTEAVGIQFFFLFLCWTSVFTV